MLEYLWIPLSNKIRCLALRCHFVGVLYFFYFTNAIQYPYNISGSPALYFLTNSVNKFNDVIT